jgi:hypothetical protein
MINIGCIWNSQFLGVDDVGPPFFVDNCSISRIVAIRKLLLSTRLFFRSEMTQGSDFGVFLHSHARSVSIGNTLPC